MTRRTLLTNTLFSLSIIGIIFVSIPFVKSMMPPQYIIDEVYNAHNSPLIIDVSNLLEGRIIIVEWQGMPIGVYKRTKNDIDSIRISNNMVYDPYSKKQTLPDWWPTGSFDKVSVDLTSKWLGTASRSKELTYFVFNMVSPIYGCAISFVPHESAEDYGFNKDWLGGFFDPCSTAKFDYAGRVYFGKSNGKHLLIPPYRFIDENTIELHPNG